MCDLAVNVVGFKTEASWNAFVTVVKSRRRLLSAMERWHSFAMEQHMDVCIRRDKSLSKILKRGEIEKVECRKEAEL